MNFLQSDSTLAVSNSSSLIYLLKEANPVLGFQWASIPIVFPNFEFPPHQEFLLGASIYYVSTFSGLFDPPPQKKTHTQQLRKHKCGQNIKQNCHFLTPFPLKCKRKRSTY